MCVLAHARIIQGIYTELRICKKKEKERNTFDKRDRGRRRMSEEAEGGSHSYDRMVGG